jgi:hypothetical protein
MYGLKYTIPFKTISDIDCIVNVELKDYIGSSVELIGGGEPFSIDTEDVDVLAPIRSSLATLSVYGSDYLKDLYTSDPQGIRIKLLVNGSVKWIGFLTPDTFNQDFSSPEFIYEMECVAALSTLKHKKFDLTADKVTFLDIIKRARDLSSYVDLYLTDSVRGKLDENIYELAGVASGNFFDELNEAMTYYEVLEEIAKYLGCCFTPFEDDLYLLDYLAIKKGFNGYHKYSGNTKTSVTLSDSREVNSVGYKGTGSTISRIPGKNKISVNCSLYEVKDFLPNIDDAVEKSAWSGYSEISYRKNSKSPTHTLITVPLVCDDNSNVYYYYSDMTPIVSDQKPFTAEAYSALMKVVRYTSDNVPTKLSFDSELFVKNYSSRANALDGKILQETHPVLNLKSEKRFFVHNKIYFAFSCEVQVNIENNDVSGDDGRINTDPTEEASSDMEWRIPAKLRIGNYYYNGSAWTTTNSVFYVPIPIKKGSSKFGTLLKTKNTNTYTMGLGDLSGYIINPPSTPIFGDIELTLYAIYNASMASSLILLFGAKWTFIKNIKLEQTIQDLEGIYEFKEEKEDLIYESEISEDFIDEADDIDLKICTNTDGKISLSSVITDSGLLSGIKSLSVPFNGVAEEAIIEKALQIYDSPRYQINPTLNNVLLPYSLVTENHLPGSTFVVCGGEENVKMESCTYNLIEI